MLMKKMMIQVRIYNHVKIFSIICVKSSNLVSSYHLIFVSYFITTELSKYQMDMALHIFLLSSNSMKAPHILLAHRLLSGGVLLQRNSARAMMPDASEAELALEAGLLS